MSSSMAMQFIDDLCFGRTVIEAENIQELKRCLLREVWGFSPQAKISPGKRASYFRHYQGLLYNSRLLDEQVTALGDSEHRTADIIELVKVVKRHSSSPIGEIHDAIQNMSADWLPDGSSTDDLNVLLDFAVRLWLFVKPDLSDTQVTLKDAVKNTFSHADPVSEMLLQDFSADALIERGQFQITYTSDLTKHLTFQSKSTIRVFRHASILQQFEKLGECRQMYPDGLLSEMRTSFNLLWPVEYGKVADRVSKLEIAHEVDIEAGLVINADKHDLGQHPMLGQRLKRLQDRLEAQERRLANSKTFTIALWGIIFTAVFGLISAITGIMQVWAVLHPPRP